jgi:hypothetical protein
MTAPQCTRTGPMSTDKNLRLLAATKTAGSTTIRIHVYDFDAGVWAHDDAQPGITIEPPFWGFSRTLTNDELDAFVG